MGPCLAVLLLFQQDDVAKLKQDVQALQEKVSALERRQDITLIKAVARAFRWRRMLEAGRFATVNELAAAEKINSSYVSRVLRLTLLAPDIVEAILDGRQPEGMALPGLMNPFPLEWERQSGPG